MIIRLTDHGHLYDLSDGSLSMDPIGTIKTTGEDVYSAEQLHNDLGGYDVGWRLMVIITGFTDEDVEMVIE